MLIHNLKECPNIKQRGVVTSLSEYCWYLGLKQKQVYNNNNQPGAHLATILPAQVTRDDETILYPGTIYIGDNIYMVPSRHKTINQYWLKVCPPSTTIYILYPADTRH